MARPAMKVMAPNRMSTPISAAARASGDRGAVGVAVMVFLRRGRAAGAFSPECDAPAEALTGTKRGALPAHGSHAEEDGDLRGGAGVAPFGLPRTAIGRQIGDLEHRVGRETGVGKGVE